MLDDAPFLGFGPSALRWFEGLEANNAKPWFDANRDAFEADVKGPLTRLLDEAAARIGGSAKVFRQNRDVRFSKDKAPYKTSAYGVVRRDGPMGLYVSVDARGVHAGTGLYAPAKDQLDRWRAAVADPETGEAAEVAVATVRAAGVRVFGDALKSAPRGVAKDHPRIELLRLKSILMIADLGPAGALDGRRPLEFALETWAAVQPMVRWMEVHVGESALTEDHRG